MSRAASRAADTPPCACADLMVAGCAGRELSVAQLDECLVFEGWEPTSPTPSLLSKWVHGSSAADRRRLVMLVTGRVSPAAPSARHGAPDRMQEPAIVVRCWPELPPDGRQPDEPPIAAPHVPPRALRAAWELLLPDYGDMRTLNSMMDAALRKLPEAAHGHAR